MAPTSDFWFLTGIALIIIASGIASYLKNKGKK